MKWYQKNREEVLKKLNSSQNNGLTKSTVVELQQTHGLNPNYAIEISKDYLCLCLRGV